MVALLYHMEDRNSEDTDEAATIDALSRKLTKENIEALHSANIKVNCWTVDSKEDAEKLAMWGVDFITSNILE